MTGSSNGFWSRVAATGRFLEDASLVLLLTGMVLLAATQILLRNFSGAGFGWGDEALRLLVLWVAMFGAVAASRDDRHISIDVLSRFLPERWQLGIRAFTNLVTAAVALMLAWFCGEFVADAREYEDVLLGGQPAWIFQAVLPLAFALMGLRYLTWCGKRIVELWRGGSA